MPDDTNRTSPDIFRLRQDEAAARAVDPEVHVLGPGIVCATDTRGHATPKGRSRTEIVLDASGGFIPLWAMNTTLRWRFQESSLMQFAKPDAVKSAFEELLGEAVLAWGDAMPVRFAKREDLWDFEIAFRPADRCTLNGCVLASAFFPDAGRHELVVYPKMFTQPRKEQVDTLIHEIGHIFGLRHFFANVSETAWPSVIYGEHKPFSIMNYGNQSELTDSDREDLKRLYKAAWSGALTHVNGTPIRFVQPFHAVGTPAPNMAASGGPPANVPLRLATGTWSLEVTTGA
jgi:hypothetical protein